jgi:hypothetical protein
VVGTAVVRVLVQVAVVVVRRIFGRLVVRGISPGAWRRVCWLRVVVAVPGITAWVVRVVG